MSFFLRELIVAKNFSKPYLVSIGAGHPYCNGALLNENWVITTASCYKSRVSVQLGGEANETKQMYCCNHFLKTS